MIQQKPGGGGAEWLSIVHQSCYGTTQVVPYCIVL